LHRDLDLTMIYVTHDQTEALTFADTVVVMHDGRVVQSGTPAELFDKPEHTFVGYFIGSPGMNIVPAEVRGREARISGHPIALERSYDSLPPDAKIEVGVRPEFVNVAPPAPGLPSANIERIDDLGRVRFARVRIGEAKFAARVPSGFSIPGETAGLVFDPAHVHIYADSRLVEGTANGQDNQPKAWFLVLPVFLVVAFSAILPLMTVVNYSNAGHLRQQPVLLERRRLVQGTARSVDRSRRALPGFARRNLFFSFVILAIEVRSGSWWRCRCARRLDGGGVPRDPGAAVLIPWNVVGTIWQIFGRPDIGLLGYTLNGIGLNYNYVSNESTPGPPSS